MCVACHLHANWCDAGCLNKHQGNMCRSDQLLIEGLYIGARLHVEGKTVHIAANAAHDGDLQASKACIVTLLAGDARTGRMIWRCSITSVLSSFRCQVCSMLDYSASSEHL
jgi:hypothetical protein